MVGKKTVPLVKSGQQVSQQQMFQPQETNPQVLLPPIKEKKTKIEPKAESKKETKRDKRTKGDPDNYKIQTRNDVKKKLEESWDNSYIPVKIVYYFDWKCPKCKKNNIQEYSNIYHVFGPAWSATGVTCSKCEMHFNILEDLEEFEE